MGLHRLEYVIHPSSTTRRITHSDASRNAVNGTYVYDRRDARDRSIDPTCFLNSTNCRDEDGGGGDECAAERDASARVEIDRSVDRSVDRSFDRVEEDVEEDANEASFKGETLKSSFIIHASVRNG